MGLLRTVIFVCCALGPTVVWAQGSAAPAISLRDTQGRMHSIEHFAGKPGVVHFWATWCSSCLTELPQLIKTADELENQGLTFTLIAADSRIATHDYLQAQSLDAVVLIDQYGKAMRGYKIKALPTSIFIDTNGQITATRQGRIDWESPTEREKLQQLLQ